MRDPDVMLARLGRVLHQGAPIPPSVASWLLAGIQQVRAGQSLDEALGLKAASKPSTATVWRMAVRNCALREACELAGSPQALHDALSRFQAGKWRRWRDLDSPPESATDLEQRLWSACRHGPVPESLRHLVRIVRT